MFVSTCKGDLFWAFFLKALNNQKLFPLLHFCNPFFLSHHIIGNNSAVYVDYLCDEIKNEISIDRL